VPTLAPTSGQGHFPADHPPHVYLTEVKVNDALLAFLAKAIFGLNRVDDWQRCLDATAEPEREAPRMSA
jgi:hypothetical protein